MTKREKRNKTIKVVLALTAIAGFRWLYFDRLRRQMFGPDIRMAQSQSAPSMAALPTDSMLPGTLGPAVQGMLKEGDTVRTMGWF